MVQEPAQWFLWYSWEVLDKPPQIIAPMSHPVILTFLDLSRSRQVFCFRPTSGTAHNRMAALHLSEEKCLPASQQVHYWKWPSVIPTQHHFSAVQKKSEKVQENCERPRSAFLRFSVPFPYLHLWHSTFTIHQLPTDFYGTWRSHHGWTLAWNIVMTTSRTKGLHWLLMWPIYLIQVCLMGTDHFLTFWTTLGYTLHNQKCPNTSMLSQWGDSLKDKQNSK